MRYTEAEREEAAYELWVMSGERDRHYAANHIAALQYIEDVIRPAGWKVLETEMKKEPFTDYAVLNVTVRKDYDVRFLRWAPFNKGFMEKLDYGWGIFYPNGSPIRKTA